MDKPIYGKVMDISDPEHLSRVRIAVLTRTDTLKKEELPWYVPIDSRKLHSLPELNELVEVFLIDNDIHLGAYRKVHKLQLQLSDQDYQSAQILALENLNNFQDSGLLKIQYLKSIGLQLFLNDSEITIRRDQTVFLYNTTSGKHIHISNESISLGSETKSKEPATLGQTNVDMLNQINDEIKRFQEIVTDNCNDLAKSAKTSPYTLHLVPLFKKFAIQLNTEISKIHDQNKIDFEKTKSTVVSLD